MADPLRRASTQYDDWRGTVALEESRARSLGESLGIDSERYLLVGFRCYRELEGHAFVYAVDTKRKPKELNLDEWAEQNSGKLPVTEFELDLDVAAFIAELDRFSMVVDEQHGVRYEVDIVESLPEPDA